VEPTPRPPHPVTHIFFDVDGTLVNFQSSLRAGLEGAARYISERLDRLVPPSALQEARDRVARSQRGRPLTSIREESFRQVLRERGVNDEDAVREANRIFYDHRDGALVSYDDVIEPLTILRDRGFIMVAATNGNAALMRTPVFDLLHETWGADEAGFAKPHPRFFEGALAKVGASAAASLMVGDRLDNDVEPALAGGMRAILIDRDGAVDAANVDVEVIRSLRELPERVVLPD
jgi:HAD superfamily hydrolase (TIGR01509 family)